MITGNTHFAIATHLLACMALHPGRLLSSRVLSETVPTNPTFLRLVLGRLRDAGLVHSQRGHAGGSRLAVDPEELTLLHVYRAIEGQAQVSQHDCSQTECRLAALVPTYLAQVSRRVDTAVAAVLGEMTIADLARQVCPA